MTAMETDKQGDGDGLAGYAARFASLGGKARALRLSARRRRDIARRAGLASGRARAAASARRRKAANSLSVVNSEGVAKK
jgi:hypothetical protein